MVFDFTAISQTILQVSFVPLVLILAIPVLIILFQIIYNLLRVQRIRTNSAELVFMEVKVPADAETKITDAEQMFAGLSGMEGIMSIGDRLFGGDNFVSFEIVAEYEQIRFLVVCPKDIHDLVARHINGVYPTAEVSQIKPYSIYDQAGKFAENRINLTNPHPYIPLTTYEGLSSDTISSLLENMSAMAEQEAATLQIVIHPISEGWRISGKKYIDQVQYEKTVKEKTEYKVGEEAINGIRKKIEKIGFGVELKMITRSVQKSRARSHIRQMLSTLSQFASPGQNSFKPTWRGFGFTAEYEHRFPKFSLILNTAELASIYHFPSKNIKAPHIQWLQAVKGEASNLVPAQPGQDYLWLGQAEFRGDRQDVFIKPDDRLRHMYVIGQTGAGKSKFIAGCCLRDIQMGHGTAFIDPHGSDMEWILARIPSERMKDVIIIDPSDLERPIGMNMMEFERPEQKTLIINDMLSIFDKLYDLKQTGGPIFEQYMRNAMMLVMSHPESGNTLLEVPRVLSDTKYRDLKLRYCELPEVVRFWRDEALKVEGEASLANLVPYITSKLSTFLYNDFIRPIVTQQHSTVNFRTAMDDGKIILIKLSKGLIGDVNSNFLGMIIIGKLLMAALSRENIPEEQRRPFYLYVDEFQNFLTNSIYSILSEARKYKLSLTIAHQFVGQLVLPNNDYKIRDAVFGNVGTRVYMRVGSEDSGMLEKDLAPHYNAQDLQNQANGWAYTKLLVNGAYPPPFTMHTWFGNSKYDMIPDANSAELTAQLKQFSAQTYGRAIQDINAEVASRGQSFDSISDKNASLLDSFAINVDTEVMTKIKDK